MLKAQTALATGHFSNQLGFWGAVVPPPPPPQSKNKDLQYKLDTSIFGTTTGAYEVSIKFWLKMKNFSKLNTFWKPCKGSPEVTQQIIL